MTGFGTFLRSWLFDDPRVSQALVSRSFVAGDSSLGLFGQLTDYQPAEYVTYIATSNGVYACINARTKALSSLPIKLYSKRRGKDGRRTEITSGQARDLLDAVNPRWTFPRWMDMTEQALCTWGESFTFYATKGGKPVEMWWARADRVKVHLHPTEYISHFTYDPGDGKVICFEPEETLWLRYPNVANEFQGLSPLAAARLAADTSSAAGKSNYALFRNGIQLNTLITPKEGQNFSTEQMDTLAAKFDKRFRGVDKAHRIGILQFDANVKQLSMTPKDAQFVDQMKLSLEDIARAYAVPLDKLGGQRTYANVEAAEKAFWVDCIIPEARFIAAEITEQLLPLFGGDLVAEFDDSDIDVLHEAETAKWERWQGQLDAGARTVNEYRADEGLEPVPWGDVAWMDVGKMPISSEERPAIGIRPSATVVEDAPKPDAAAEVEQPVPSVEPETKRILTRGIGYGSPDHHALWERLIEVQEPWEKRIRSTTISLFLDQQQSVLATLRKRRLRAAEELLLDPFDRSRWIKSFRIIMRPLVAGVMAETGQLAINELGFGLAFDIKDPRVIELLERQVNRYAEGVNNTTWQAIREAIAEGVNARESTDQIADRIQQVFAGRRQDAEAIAQTEVTTAYNTATLEGWKQSRVVTRKRWLAALDGRVRATHREAHGQEVGIDDDFLVGAGAGPCPGSIGVKAEDVRCRCSMVAVLDVEGGA